MRMKTVRKFAYRTFKGSFTIEASYLLPLIVFLIGNILYLSFFSYDQSTIMQGNYCTALKTERLIAGKNEKIASAEEKYNFAVREKVVCGKIRCEKDVTEEAVTIGTKLDMSAPGGYYFQSIWHGQQKQRVEKWQPATFIRNCRKAERIKDLLQTGNG